MAALVDSTAHFVLYDFPYRFRRLSTAAAVNCQSAVTRNRQEESAQLPPFDRFHPSLCAELTGLRQTANVTLGWTALFDCMEPHLSHAATRG